MIIEFIGSTGSGKTTLISKALCELVKRTNATISFDLIAAPLGLRGVSHPTVRNLIEEIVGLPFFIRSFSRHKDFLACTYRMFSRNTGFSFHTINNLRSLERKLAAHEIIRLYCQDRIVLVDEGPMLAAHMFAFSGAYTTPSELAVFAELLPSPDLIIYVRAPIDTLVKRTMQRADPPREMKINDPALTRSYIRRAVEIFDQLVEDENIRNRLLIVDNPDVSEKEHSILVSTIVEYILNHKCPSEATIKGQVGKKC